MGIYVVFQLVVKVKVLGGYILLEQQCEDWCDDWLQQVEWFLVLFWEDVQQVIVDVIVYVMYIGVGVVVEIVGFVLVVGGGNDVLFVGIVIEFGIIGLVELVVYYVVVQFYVFQDF